MHHFNAVGNEIARWEREAHAFDALHFTVCNDRSAKNEGLGTARLEGIDDCVADLPEVQVAR